jgi:uncharacterized repeat protein (TIGR01451 family)
MITYDTVTDACPASSVDLAVVKTAPATVATDTNLTYTIAIGNNGPDSATNVTVTDTIPANTIFESATGPAGFALITPIAGNTGTVTATIASLPVGAAGNLTIVVHVLPAPSPPVGTVLSNTAGISSGSPDSNANNDSSTVTTTIVAASSDLEITATAPSSVAPGSNLTYTGVARNNGPSDASNIDASDTLPPGTTFVSATAPPGVTLTTPPVGGTGTVHSTASFFASGTSASGTITVRVNSDVAPGTIISNTSTISGSPVDPTPANNSSTANTSVVAPPVSQVVTVTATKPTAFEGGTHGELTFTRSGSTVATLTISDLISGTATQGTDYATLGTVTFPAGQSTVTKAVNAFADNVADESETVIVTIQASSGYTVGSPSNATVRIREPNGSPPFCAPAPVSTYSDRADAGVHARNVDCITWAGLALGFTDNTYRPNLQVSRAQMASFVARLVRKAGVSMPAHPADAFPGDDGQVHELDINQLFAVGVLDGTTGEQGSFYGVADPMRRDDMAKILFNAFRLITGSPLPAGPNAFTDDTNGGDPHGAGTNDEAAINALFQANVVFGTGDGQYNPTGSVSRAQFASFFVRLMQILVDEGFLHPPTA